MQNFSSKTAVVQNIFDLCNLLEKSTYVVSIHHSYITIQAEYSAKIIKALKSEYGFEFSVCDQTSFITSNKKLLGFDFEIEIILT